MKNSSRFGEYLVIQRGALRWSQEEMAERSGVSVRTIRNLETGSITNPRRGSVQSLLSALRSAGVDDVPARFTARAVNVPLSIGSDMRRWVGPRPASEPLVGCHAALSAICDEIAANRWIVITGPGGVGKTRLALAAAERMGEAPDCGVVVIPAAELVGTPPRGSINPNLIHQNVVEGLRRLDGASHDTTVPSTGRMRALVVIDNAEHVLDDVTRASHGLLAEFPRLRILVTSRRALAVPSVREWEMGPLGSDDCAADAAELFVQRARSVCPSLVLSSQASAVTALCRQLDYVPQAIELAALWLRSISLDTLLRSEPIHRVLAQVSRTGLPHQRSLAGSVRWSYDMLGPQHQRLLHQMAALRMPFTMEEFERHSRMGGRSNQDVVTLLPELIDSSLLQVRHGVTYSYRMFGYVRQILNNWATPQLPARRVNGHVRLPALRGLAMGAAAVKAEGTQRDASRPGAGKHAGIRYGDQTGVPEVA